MMPGPERIIACPQCDKMVRHPALQTEESYGARVWTDGKQESIDSPEPPQVVRCSGCQEIYWLEDGRVQGEMTPYENGLPYPEIDPDWAGAPLAEEPTDEQYFEALANGLARNKMEERTLRVFAWWRSNDHHRDDAITEALQTATGSRRANLEALVHLLDGEEMGELLMKAEVLRQLGEFDAARRLLAELPSGDLEPIVEQLRILCDARDICVRELLLVE